MIWQLAFRPFFLFGALASAVFMTLWLGFLFGFLPRLGFLPPNYWHGHEMVFGFTVAIVVGFVLTAIRNWTGLVGFKGTRLKLLVTFWFVGRLAMLLPHGGIIPLIASLLFYPAAALALFPYFKKDPELKMERVFFVFLFLFMLGDLSVHLTALQLLDPSFYRRGLYLGFNTALVIVVFMGGRVIPFFTESSIARRQPRTFKSIEIGSAISAWIFLAAHAWNPESSLVSVAGIGAAIFHGIRLWGWQVPRVRRVPLIWVLHLAYLWIVVGYLLSALVPPGIISSPTALHALTVGGLGLVILGMISRVSLGHTGRPLHPHKITVVGYICLGLSALVRVFGSWISGNSYGWASQVSGGLWVLGFVLFLWVYFPILTQPRVDGRPG